MLRDVYWRQYPIDLLTDEKMMAIECKMPAGLEYAPYMFYITALKLANNDGVFNLDDAEIIARLMRINHIENSRQLVIDIANLLMKYKIIYRIGIDNNFAGLVDWSNGPNDKKPKTMEERRRAIADAIEKEKSKTVCTQDFSLDGNAGKRNDVPQSESCAGRHNDVPQANTDQPGKRNDVPAADSQKLGVTAPQTGVFLLPENDKNAQNVELNAMDDKNAQNVEHTQTIHTDNTTQEVNNTHTQTQTDSADTDKQPSGSGHIESPTPESCKDRPAVAEKRPDTNNKNSKAECSTQVDLLAEQALALGEDDSERNDNALFDYLADFFVKNCKGFRVKQSVKALRELLGKIQDVSDEVNPPLEVASVLCSEFKKMCAGERNKYWKDLPLLPSYMIKPRCWIELMQYAGKILATNAQQNKFWSSMEQAAKECEADREEVQETIQQEFRRYKINPDAPDATRQLIEAKSREFEAKRQQYEADGAETVPYDIF